MLNQDFEFKQIKYNISCFTDCEHLGLRHCQDEIWHIYTHIYVYICLIIFTVQDWQNHSPPQKKFLWSEKWQEIKIKLERLQVLNLIQIYCGWNAFVLS